MGTRDGSHPAVSVGVSSGQGTPPKNQMVTVHCKTCGETFSLDIGTKSRDEIEAGFAKQGAGFECPGHHVEIGARADHWEIDWSTLREGKAPSDDEFLQNLKEQYQEVYDTDQLRASDIEITSFSFGLPIAKSKIDGSDITLDFTSAPSGKRYYYVVHRDNPLKKE